MNLGGGNCVKVVDDWFFNDDRKWDIIFFFGIWEWCFFFSIVWKFNGFIWFFVVFIFVFVIVVFFFCLSRCKFILSWDFFFFKVSLCFKNFRWVFCFLMFIFFLRRIVDWFCDDVDFLLLWLVYVDFEVICWEILFVVWRMWLVIVVRNWFIIFFFLENILRCFDFLVEFFVVFVLIRNFIKLLDDVINFWWRYEILFWYCCIICGLIFVVFELNLKIFVLIFFYMWLNVVVNFCI